MDSLPFEQADFLRYLLRSGTYGNSNRMVENRLDKQKAQHEGNLGAAKRGYLRERLTNDEALGCLFPRASRITPLRPALQLVRYARGIVRNPKKLANEVKLLIRAK